MYSHRVYAVGYALATESSGNWVPEVTPPMAAARQLDARRKRRPAAKAPQDSRRSTAKFDPFFCDVLILPVTVILRLCSRRADFREDM